MTRSPTTLAWLLVLASSAAACGEGSEPGEGQTTEPDESSGSDETSEPAPAPLALCPSLGLAPDAPLLVVAGESVARVVRADGSMRELDAGPEEPVDDGPWVDFGVSPTSIATMTTWPGLQRLSLFSPGGDLRWTTDIHESGGAVTVHASEDGVMAFDIHHSTWTVSDGVATEHEGFILLAVPKDSRVAVARIVEDEGTVSAGWIDLETHAYDTAPVLGDVTSDGDTIGGTRCFQDHTELYVADAEGVVAHVEIPDVCLDYRGSVGSSYALYHHQDVDRVVLVDHETLVPYVVPIEPPPGHARLHCGTPSFGADGIAVAFSDGTHITQHRLRADHQWERTSALPIADTYAAVHYARSGTHVMRSWRHSQCDQDPLLPPVDGALQGETLQLWRPSTQLMLVWEQLPERTFEAFSADGRCVAWTRDDEHLVVVDMVSGAHETLAVPTAGSVRFSDNRDRSVGWAYDVW